MTPIGFDCRSHGRACGHVVLAQQAKREVSPQIALITVSTNIADAQHWIRAGHRQDREDHGDPSRALCTFL